MSVGAEVAGVSYAWSGAVTPDIHHFDLAKRFLTSSPGLSRATFVCVRAYVRGRMRAYTWFCTYAFSPCRDNCVLTPRFKVLFSPVR